MEQSSTISEDEGFPIPWCNACFDQLDEPGALIFGPPDEDGLAKKWHICAFCYDTVFLHQLKVLPQDHGTEKD